MSKKSLPPFPKEKHWLFGSAYHLRGNPLPMLRVFKEKYGDIHSLSSPVANLTAIYNPEFVKYVTQENAGNYTKSMAYDFLRLLLGNGLVTSEGDEWKQNRKLIQPAFHKNKLNDFVSIMQSCTEALFTTLDAHADKKQKLDIAPMMNHLALAIISKCMFKTGVEGKANRVSQLVDMLNNMMIHRINNPFEIPAFSSKYPKKKQDLAIQELNSMIYEMIHERRLAGGPDDDLLGMLLFSRDEESGAVLSDSQLRDELMTIFVAGHETTANALAWAIHALNDNPQVADTLYDEVKSFTDKKLDIDFLMQHSYLKMFADELLRVYPPIWIIGRRTINEDEIGGFRIRKMTNILMPIYLYHHDKNFWTNPEVFDPYRFRAEEKSKINRFMYFPFGAGARYCIGNHFALTEIYAIIGLLHSRYTFKLAQSEPSQLETLVTLKPKGGVWVIPERR